MADYKLPTPPQGLIWKHKGGSVFDKLALIKQGFLFDKEVAFFYASGTESPEALYEYASRIVDEATAHTNWDKVCYEANKEALEID